MARGKKRAHTVFRIMEKKAKKNPPIALHRRIPKRGDDLLSHMVVQYHRRGRA